MKILQILLILGLGIHSVTSQCPDIDDDGVVTGADLTLLLTAWGDSSCTPQVEYPCECVDADGDGVNSCVDCDDGDASNEGDINTDADGDTVFACDDCDDSVPGDGTCECTDNDLDGFNTCEFIGTETNYFRDCNDNDLATKNCECLDYDGDTVNACVDCDDNDPANVAECTPLLLVQNTDYYWYEAETYLDNSDAYIGYESPGLKILPRTTTQIGVFYSYDWDGDTYADSYRLTSIVKVDGASQFTIRIKDDFGDGWSASHDEAATGFYHGVFALKLSCPSAVCTPGSCVPTQYCQTVGYCDFVDAPDGYFDELLGTPFTPDNDCTDTSNNAWGDSVLADASPASYRGYPDPGTYKSTSPNTIPRNSTDKWARRARDTDITRLEKLAEKAPADVPPPYHSAP